jgi:polysaccharide deacetylase family protein (PEP-CTERM system associated)
MLNALTIDVEEWFHVCGIERKVPRERWDELESRVEISVRRVLDLLDGSSAKATFFFLGWVAQRHPDLVRLVRDAGHEIASHGMWHRKVFQMTSAEFEADVREARDLMAEITGAAPAAYRAPEWSIDLERRAWAYPILAKLGFTCDSSVSPLSWISGARLETDPFLWCDPAAPPELHGARGHALRVFPVTTMRLFWEHLPFTGGMGFRTSPYWYTAYFFEQLEKRGVPGMIYLHPWEFDDAQPRLPLGPFVRWMHGFNRPAVARNAGGLLRHFRFGTLADALDAVVARPGARIELQPPPAERAKEAVA